MSHSMRMSFPYNFIYTFSILRSFPDGGERWFVLLQSADEESLKMIFGEKEESDVYEWLSSTVLFFFPLLLLASCSSFHRSSLSLSSLLLTFPLMDDIPAVNIDWTWLPNISSSSSPGRLFSCSSLESRGWKRERLTTEQYSTVQNRQTGRIETHGEWMRVKCKGMTRKMEEERWEEEGGKSTYHFRSYFRTSSAGGSHLPHPFLLFFSLFLSSFLSPHLSSTTSILYPPSFPSTSLILISPPASVSSFSHRPILTWSWQEMRRGRKEGRGKRVNWKRVLPGKV